ncbi:MAG: lipoyl(octanoyl) transferase LipB, partial [Planctomycetota bacterium]
MTIEESDLPSRQPIPYESALRRQEFLVAARQESRIADCLWLLEHEPTITFGTKGGQENLRGSETSIEASGFRLVPTRRGGDVTCHEPGQLVGYPVVSIEKDRDLHEYLRCVEESIILSLARFGLDGHRVEGRTGVWLSGDRPPRKIAAIGVRCQRWVTSH